MTTSELTAPRADDTRCSAGTAALAAGSVVSTRLLSADRVPIRTALGFVLAGGEGSCCFR